jgi:N-acetylglucosamine kinase-like BadF-type ATPase
LPYWLTQFDGHPLRAIEVPGQASRQVRAYAEAGDEMALRIFEQQAMALGTAAPHKAEGSRQRLSLESSCTSKLAARNSVGFKASEPS